MNVLIVLVILAVAAFFVVKKQVKKGKLKLPFEIPGIEAPKAEPSAPTPAPLAPPPQNVFIPAEPVITPVPVAPAETLIQAASRRKLPPGMWGALTVFAQYEDAKLTPDQMIDLFIAKNNLPQNPNSAASEVPGTGPVPAADVLRNVANCGYLWGEQGDYRIATGRDLVRDVVNGTHLECSQIIAEGSRVNPSEGNYFGADQAVINAVVDAWGKHAKR